MKSYWIAAAVILLTAWPTSSKGYVVGVSQSQTDDKPVSQASNPSPNAKDTAQPQAQPGSPKPAVISGPIAGSAANSQNKGSYMLVELTKSLKAKKLKPGDKVKAEVTQDVLSHGKIIIPVETELAGHVTEVSVRDPEHPESRLGIVFDSIMLKHFHDIHFQGVVQALAPPVVRRSRVDEPSQMLPPSMMGVGAHNTGAMTVSRRTGSGTSRASANQNMSTAVSAGNAANTFDMPVTTTHADGAAAQLSVGKGGAPLSIGTPQGVTGLKGLSLDLTPDKNTPGPVIVSNKEDVKLDSGTQILLRVLSVEAPQNAEQPK
ncbi:MAG TPA: hypothetical protein VGK24_13585 [Candidatus Angelobacter sp.]|jgi:biotin carboxyl carrier protein